MGTLVAVLASTALGETTLTQVNAAIAKGVAFLEQQQRQNGAWIEYETEPGGATALCTLALLHCGRTVDDASVKASLNYLESLPDSRRTYTDSLKMMAFAAADKKRYFLKIERIAKGLEASQMRDGRSRGGWHYRDSGGGTADNSTTHFALLALDEAEKAGVKTSAQTWQHAQTYWTQNGMQKSSGGYGYTVGLDDTSGSMTCAAITSLLIVGNHLQPGEANVIDDRVQCCGPQWNSDAIERALQWLGNNFSVSRNPAHRSGGWWLYYLWSLEHTGALSNQRHFVNSTANRQSGSPIAHDWYREGCDALLQYQNEPSAGAKVWNSITNRSTVMPETNGAWVGRGVGESTPEIGTAFALLFLAHGRRPVVIGRLRHNSYTAPEDSDWNHHGRALANLVSHVGQQWGRELAWQMIDFRSRPIKSDGRVRETVIPTAAELSEIPVLFLSGFKAFEFSAGQRQLLKDYLTNGGLLLAESCSEASNDHAFDRSFRQLLREVLPKHELRKLPPDHAIWFAQQKVDQACLPNGLDFELWGLDAGYGPIVLYSPRSLSCYWDLAGRDRASIGNERVDREVDHITRLGANALAFATAREPRERLEQRYAMKDLGGKPRSGAIVVPELASHDDTEPALSALGQLVRVVESRFDRAIDYDKRSISAANLRPSEHPIAFVHGRHAFQLSETERHAIKEYIGGGGLIFAAAILSSEEFSDSFRRELMVLFPAGEIARLPASHPIFTETYSGFHLASVAIREPQERTEAEGLTVKITTAAPVLEGVTVDGRVVAILSPYDISYALSRGPSLEHRTYVADDALRLGVNALLFGLQHRSGRLR